MVRGSGYQTGFRNVLKLLSEEELDQIHLSSLEILQEKGVKISHNTILEMLEGAGAKVDFKNETVRMSSTLVESCLKKSPKAFTLASRSGKYDLELTPEGRTYVRSTGGPEYILDPDTGERRKITTDDLRDYTRIIDTLRFGISNPYSGSRQSRRFFHHKSHTARY